MLKLCIGLFGTCGTSNWRKKLFIPSYEMLGWKDGKEYFNPQLPVGMWDKLLSEGKDPALTEADHLKNDIVLCFAVTNETYGCGSLSEIAFSILQVAMSENRRDTIIFVDPDLSPKLIHDNSVAANESLRSRALVLEHLKQVRMPFLHIAANLRDMLDLSVFLFQSAQKFHNPW